MATTTFAQIPEIPTFDPMEVQQIHESRKSDELNLYPDGSLQPQGSTGLGQTKMGTIPSGVLG